MLEDLRSIFKVNLVKRPKCVIDYEGILREVILSILREALVKCGRADT